MPVRTFVEAQDLSGKIILPFASSGGSDIVDSVNDLRKTLPKAQVKDGLLANMTGRIDGWLKENGLVKPDRKEPDNAKHPAQFRLREVVSGCFLNAQMKCALAVSKCPPDAAAFPQVLVEIQI